jgi:hypothetical protein
MLKIVLVMRLGHRTLKIVPQSIEDACPLVSARGCRGCGTAISGVVGLMLHQENNTIILMSIVRLKRGAKFEVFEAAVQSTNQVGIPVRCGRSQIE